MEFESKIATTREQSNILLSVGIKPETADMVYHYTNSRSKSFEWELQAKAPTLRGGFWTQERISKLKSPFHKHPDGTLMSGDEIFDSLWGKDIPAWTIWRLLEMMPPMLNNCGTLYLCAGLNIERYNKDNTDISHRYNIQFGVGSVTKNYENPFDAIIESIELLIKMGKFNVEYLKDK